MYYYIVHKIVRKKILVKYDIKVKKIIPNIPYMAISLIFNSNFNNFDKKNPNPIIENNKIRQ